MPIKAVSACGGLLLWQCGSFRANVTVAPNSEPFKGAPFLPQGLNINLLINKYTATKRMAVSCVVGHIIFCTSVLN